MKKWIKKHSSSKLMILFLSVGFVFIFLIIAGSSYAYFVTTVKGKEMVIYTGTLAVNYAKKTDVISNLTAYPMSDTEGFATTAHEFTVTNNGNIDARYRVRLETDSTVTNMIDLRYVKISYQVDGNEYSTPMLLSDLGSSLVFIKNNVLTPSSSNTIGIKLWIDLNAGNDIQNKEFKARIVVDSIQNVDDGYVADTIPIIYLNKDSNGNQDIHLTVGDTYNELGVEKIEDDKDIFTTDQATISYEYYDGSNLNVVSSVDTSKTGIYYVNYSVTDSANNTCKVTRVVTVNNSSIIPSISLVGDSSITITEGDTYIESGVSVTDSNRVVTIGVVNTKAIGDYVIRYIVIDSNGNLNSVIRNVKVIGLEKLSTKILADNTLITKEPTLTTSSNNTNDASGLYSSTATNSGNPTYYFRGNVENNYVSFAGYTWRIVRVNEDGTIRIVMQDGINNNATYKFSLNNNNYTYMYYSNSNAKTQLNSWYQTNIGSKSDLANKVVSGNYYCEQAKAKYSSSYTSGSASMTVYSSYTPNFKCTTDGNGKGQVNASVGLLSYDEVVYAGGYYSQKNSNYYLYNNNYFWTMSPAGFSGSYSSVWRVNTPGYISNTDVRITLALRPVLILKADTLATGSGTSSDPYEIQLS